MHISRNSLKCISAFITGLICILCVMCLSSSKASALVHNSRFDNCEKLYGIDVSRWQGDINWKKVKADGVDFVIIRLGYSDHGDGDHYIDQNYYTNISGAKAAGLKVGVYYYSTAITRAEAVSEAEFVLKVLNGTKLDLPVYFDQECTDGRVDPSSITTWSMTQFALDFLARIKEGGYEAGYYSSVSWIMSEIDASSIETKYPIWIANVTNQTSYSGVYHMWQYSFTGQVNGISTAVDRDVLYVSETPAKVTGVKAALNTNTATISWKKAAGAEGYHIYKKENGSSALVGDVGASTLTFSVPATPVSTEYYVCAYNKNYGVFISDGAPSASVFVKADVPYGLSSTNGLTSIKLSWQPLEGASGYVVYIDRGGAYEPVGNTTESSFKLTKLTSNTKYDLAVAAYYNADASTEYVDGVSTLSPISITHHTGTQNVKATNIKLKTNTPTSQTLTWTAPSGYVDGYRVYFYNTETGKYTRACQVKTNSATITGLTPGTEYTYLVRSFYNTEDTTVLSQYSDHAMFSTQSTKVTNFATKTKNTTSITLTWTKPSQGKVDAYRIYSYDPSTKKYTRLVQTTATTYKLTGLKSGTPYTFLVRSFYVNSNKEYILSEYSALHTTGTQATKATGVKIKPNSATYQTVVWKKPAGQAVDGYRLYSYNPTTKKYKRLCDITGTSFKVTGLKADTEYYYMVRSYYYSGDEQILSQYSEILHCTTCYTAVKGLKATNIKKTSCKLSWTKMPGATGYNVYSVGSNGSYTLVKSVTGNSLTVSSLKSGKTYTYAVRAYKKIDNVKYLGFISAKVKVKTK